MSRVCVLIDGFNLYHALDYSPVIGRPYINPNRYKKYKWLDLAKLAKKYIFDKNDSLVGVYYFTTYAYWNPSKAAKHQQYVRAQEENGVNIVLGEFKRKTKHCNLCNNDFITHEEKQTDVNIALKIFQLAVNDVYDKVILISGDTDLIPAIKVVQTTFPQKQIGAVIPIGKISEGMKRATNFHYKMKESHLQTCLLPDPFTLSNGVTLTCPPNWK